MIVKTFAHELAKCDACGKFIIWKPAVQELPSACPYCGVPANHHLTANEQVAMEKAQQQFQQGQSGVHFSTIRFG